MNDNPNEVFWTHIFSECKGLPSQAKYYVTTLKDYAWMYSKLSYSTTAPVIYARPVPIKHTHWM